MEYMDADQFQMVNDMSRVSHRSSQYMRKQQRMSRKSSHARGVGVGHHHAGGQDSHMQHSHSHRSLFQKDLVEPSPHHQHEC